MEIRIGSTLSLIGLLLEKKPLTHSSRFRFFDSVIDSIEKSMGIENRMKKSVKESESRIDWGVRNRKRKESEKVESDIAESGVN